MQPGFLSGYGELLRIWGIHPALRTLPLRSLYQAGVLFSLSSDHPCAGLDPLANLRAAVHRCLSDGSVLLAQESLDEGDAVAAATVNGSRLLGDPGPYGLSEGARADLVVCDGHPIEDGTSVIETWVGGVREYAAHLHQYTDAASEENR